MLRAITLCRPRQLSLMPVLSALLALVSAGNAAAASKTFAGPLHRNETVCIQIQTEVPVTGLAAQGTATGLGVKFTLRKSLYPGVGRAFEQSPTFGDRIFEVTLASDDEDLIPGFYYQLCAANVHVTDTTVNLSLQSH